MANARFFQKWHDEFNTVTVSIALDHGRHADPRTANVRADDCQIIDKGASGNLRPDLLCIPGVLVLCALHGILHLSSDQLLGDIR